METLTDVAPGTVDDTFRSYGIDRIIHGHTHRPAIHEANGRQRVVLGDWYEQGSVLHVDADGVRLQALPPPQP